MKVKFNQGVNLLEHLTNNPINQNLKDIITSKIDKQVIKNFKFQTEKTKLASIEKIHEINSHPLDQNLEIAKVLQWDVVINKNEFKLNDKIIFIVIDAVIPISNWKELLNSEDKKKLMHVRTVRLNGVYSQGIILPLNILPENIQKLPEGTNVEDYLNIHKYQKYIPSYLSDEIEGEFPDYLCAQTGEQHGLSYPELVKEILSNKVITVTQKLDGSSCTIIIKDKKIQHVCSHHHILKENDNNLYWQAAKKINLDIIDNDLYIIQGELMGPKIIKNQLNLPNHEIFIFQIKNKNKFFPYMEMKNFCEQILKCKYVPHVGNFKVKKDVNIDFLQKIADEQFLPDNNPAEGIVIRPFDYPTAGNGKPLGFKIINRNYKDE